MVFADGAVRGSFPVGLVNVERLDALWLRNNPVRRAVLDFGLGVLGLPSLPNGPRLGLAVPLGAALGSALACAAADAFGGDVTRFRHLQIEDGLSQSSIYSSCQDSRGFMWLGTRNGLNRYDGYEFVVYRHDPDDPGSLSGIATVLAGHPNPAKRDTVGALGAARRAVATGALQVVAGDLKIGNETVLGFAPRSGPALPP